MSDLEYPDCDQDGLHECPVTDCTFRRHSLLALEFHVMDEHPSRHREGRR